MRILEICAFNIQSALNAQTGGAHRIELCENPSDGGTTPSFGTVKIVREKLNIPIHILIRPRGGDFCYSTEEFNAMKEDIIAYKNLRVDGFVFGILNRNLEIDIKHCEELIKICGNSSLTFHRAFDCVPNIELALEQIIQLGFHRILTSGQHMTAFDGIEVLSKLLTKAEGRINIMPGGGINNLNIEQIAINTKAMEFHMSLTKKLVETDIKNNLHLISTNSLLTTDINSVRQVVNQLTALGSNDKSITFAS